MAAAKTPVRRDPDRRRTQAGHDPTVLENRDASKKYKWVHPDDGTAIFGIRGHEQRGWVIEMSVQGGVIPQRGACSKVGQPVEMDGYVLMSIPKEEFERIEQEGVHGQTGQRYLDEVEELISAQGGINMPRASRQYFKLENETSPNALVGAEGV